MIEAVYPTDEVIISVLEGLLDGAYSRDDVYYWYGEMTTKYATQYPGCIQFHTESKQGGFIIQSLCFIKSKGLADYESDEQYFLRNEDFEEYIAELKHIDCSERNGKIERVRHHQVSPVKEINYPLICLDPRKSKVLDRFKIFSARGVVDDLALPTEYCSIYYDASYFYMTYSHSLKEYNFSISGFQGNDLSLFGLLVALGIQSSDVTFYNNVGLKGPSELWRLDDNGNEFMISEYETELEAMLMRKEYEDKGHKQTYFTKVKSV